MALRSWGIIMPADHKDYMPDSLYFNLGDIPLPKAKSTISGRGSEEVRDNLLQKAFRLKENMVRRYHELFNESAADHVRMMLETLIANEEKDLDTIREAMERSEFSRAHEPSDARSFEMLDHLVTQDLQDVNVNDMKSVLLQAMKMSNDIHNVFELMAHEYTDTKVSSVLMLLATHQLENKNYIAELYDDFVNKDYW